MTTRYRMMFCAFALAAAGIQQAAAQSTEVFGGFKFANMRPEQDYNSLAMSGWNAGATFYPTYRFGLTAEVAGYYGTAQPSASLAPNQPEVDVRQYSFLA